MKFFWGGGGGANVFLSRLFYISFFVCLFFVCLFFSFYSLLMDVTTAAGKKRHLNIKIISFHNVLPVVT